MRTAGQHATLHALAGSPGSACARALALGESYAYRGHAALIGAQPRLIARVSGPPDLLSEAAAGLPRGPARHEAIAIRLGRQGVALQWGEPEVVSDSIDLIDRCRTLGSSSLESWRADPTLLTEMQLGSWFDAVLEARLIRRIIRRPALRRSTAFRLAERDHRLLRALADAAFWAGVRREATDEEWRRLTASAYVILLYHRIAGEDRPGEERLDIAPSRFAGQMRLLRRLRFASLGVEQLLRFHSDRSERLAPRSVVVTVDDGFADCADSLLANVHSAPQLFVSTREVGGNGHWMAGEPVLGWQQLTQLAAAGVAVGSHARRHRPLTGLEPDELSEEVQGSLADLRARLPDPLEVLSYPNGRHDERVRAAAVEAGFRAGYTTEKGCNGAGTDHYCLKRVSVYGYDGRLAFAWKALTGEAVPGRWERRRAARIRRGIARPRGTVRAPGPPPAALVSLVMAAYRPRRDWLLAAVGSALAQEGCQIELIVVDDGSPEPVAELLAQIDDPRLRILRVAHGGPSHARNAGIAASRGEYIRFVDSDDLLEPRGTAHLLALSGGEQDVITYGATLNCDEQLRPVSRMTCRLDGSLASACLLDEVEVRIFSFLFPRAVIEATGPWETALPGCRDWDFVLRALEHARVRGDEELVSRYRRHPGGVTADLEACLAGERAVIARYFERHPEHVGTSLERRSRARLLRTKAQTYAGDGGNWPSYLRATAGALRLAPFDTARSLADELRARAPGLIAALRRTVTSESPR